MNLGWIEMILDDVEGAINQLLSRRLELLREEDDLTIYQKKTLDFKKTSQLLLLEILHICKQDQWVRLTYQ